VLIKVPKVLFVINHSLNLAYHWDLGGYDVEQESSSRSTWGSTFVKLATNFLSFLTKGKHWCIPPIRILLYNRIYFNDLCIYVLGVY
jgi:hypothetical protein